MAVRTRDGAALSVDAYFPDEAGMVYPNPPKDGAWLNKYTQLFVKTAGKVTEITHAEATKRKLDPDKPSDWDHIERGTLVVSLKNPLDASFNSTVKLPETDMPPAAHNQPSWYTIFAPPQLIKDVNDLLTKGQSLPRSLKVVLFFGTGTELGRHGLRSFVEKSPWRIIINVPGIEPSYPIAIDPADPTKKHQWGIGISKDQITDLVKQVFGRDVPWVVDRLCGYSTGYVGVTGTIRNNLFDLSHVETLAFFDCNYGEARVKDGIRVLRAASPMVKVMAYASSQDGTRTWATHSIDLDLDTGGAIWLLGGRDYQALTHARLLASGLADKTVDPSEIDAGLLPFLTAMFSALPPRGTVVTDPMLHQLLYGHAPASGTVTLAAWYAANKANADMFLKALWNKTGKATELARVIWKHRLPGWQGGIADPVVDTMAASAFTAGAHDFLPLEFAWEILSP